MGSDKQTKLIRREVHVGEQRALEFLRINGPRLAIEEWAIGHGRRLGAQTLGLSAAQLDECAPAAWLIGLIHLGVSVGCLLAACFACPWRYVYAKIDATRRNRHIWFSNEYACKRTLSYFARRTNNLRLSAAWFVFNCAKPIRVCCFRSMCVCWVRCQLKRRYERWCACVVIKSLLPISSLSPSRAH